MFALPRKVREEEKERERERERDRITVEAFRGGVIADSRDSSGGHTGFQGG